MKRLEIDVASKLEVFVGTWAGTERVSPSVAGLGGVATGIVSARLDLAGRALIQDYMQRRNGRNSKAVHAVITIGEYENQLRLYWFDDSGLPPRPAPGFWIGGRLFFIRTTPHGQVRHIYTPTTDHSYTHRLERSIDDGQTWEVAVVGEYLRSTA